MIAFRMRLQFAKKQFYHLAVEWLDTQTNLISNAIRTNWLSVIEKAITRDDLYTKLLELGLPIISIDKAIDCTNSPIKRVENNEHQSDLSNYFVSRLYVCNNNDQENNTLNGLCYLTNMFEQILQLEELTAPIFIDEKLYLKPLELAVLMAQNINNELCLTENGVDTLSAYSDRMMKAKGQLDVAKKNNIDTFLVLNNQLEHHLIRIHYSVKLLAKQMTECFGFEKDDRYFVVLLGLRIRSYIPWQNMIKKMAHIIFEEDGFIEPDIDNILITQSSLDELISMFRIQYHDRLTLFKQKFELLIKKSEDEIAVGSNKLYSMTSQINSEVIIGKPRLLANFILNQPLTFFSFFKAFSSLPPYLNNTPLISSSIEEEEQSALTC